MRVSLNSIKKLTPINIPFDELLEKVFTQVGAVEDIENLEKKYSGILVAKILEKEIHPDSDRLGIYKLDIGNDQTVQVVAGDRTLEVGDLVAYFTPGTKIPYNAHPEKNDNIVQKITLRGVESEGMMASEKELDLGNDHTVVLRLDRDLIPGTSFAIAYGLNDTILDVENKALANRADCFGLLGIAREISAIQNLEFKSPMWFLDSKSNKPETVNTDSLVVENQTQNNCPRYMAIVMDNIKVTKSPIWLKVELAKAGIKSINNVVDITNYLMILTSQPLHAFDYNKVIAKDTNSNGEAKIVVRQAINGEKIHALNDKVLELDDSMTVICDSQNPIAVAGIIGGMDTEIDENTTKIIIESANFNRYNIRKTSWKLGVFTDAVTRFTKAQDPSQCEAVLYQAVRLLEEHAQGKVSSNISDNYPLPKEQVSLTLELSKLSIFLGLKLEIEQVAQLLKNVEYEVEVNEDSIDIKVPSFRQDINIIEDVYEDIARIYGFNAIEVTLPTKTITPAVSNIMLDLKYRVRNIVSGLGAIEILTYNFVGSNLITNYNLDLENAFQLKNPLSPELEFMRINLIPSLCEKLKENINRGYTDVSLYEINMGHNKLEKDNEELPVERWTLSLVTTDKNEDSGSSYYSSKIYLDQLSKKLNLKTLKYVLVSDTNKDEIPTWIQLSLNQYNANRSAIVSFSQEDKTYYLGIMGELSNSVISKNNLPSRISGMEIDFQSLQSAISAQSRYQEPSRFPKVTQDLCFVVNNDIQYIELKNEIESILAQTKMYYELEPVDIYSSKEKPELKQVTFRISIQSRDKTLETSEYNLIKENITAQLQNKYQATLL